MRKLHVLALLPIFCSSFVLADQVVLTNGDRLTGTITKSDSKTLLLKTDFAGDITIQWSAVQNVQSSQPLHVATAAKTVVGTVTTSDSTLQVQTSSGSESIPKDQVTALRNDQEQAVFEKGLHPSLWQGWAIGANVGFALTGGNSETKSLALAYTGDRKTSHDEITMYENTVYATNDAPHAIPGVTANTNQGGARYSRNLTSRLFGYGSADFQTDALQELNLRSILGGGFGVHLINTSQTTLDILGGLNYTHESYGFVAATATTPAQPPVSRGFAAVTIGEEFMRKLGKSTVVTEKGYFFPAITEPTGVSSGQYRATFNFGTVTKLNKWLGWQNAFGDIYVTNPPASTKKNDLLLTTGLNITLTH
jgi:putative salt-induced outer membrane protein YdiY